VVGGSFITERERLLREVCGVSLTAHGFLMTLERGEFVFRGKHNVKGGQSS